MVLCYEFCFAFSQFVSWNLILLLENNIKEKRIVEKKEEKHHRNSINQAIDRSMFNTAFVCSFSDQNNIDQSTIIRMKERKETGEFGIFVHILCVNIIKM